MLDRQERFVPFDHFCRFFQNLIVADFERLAMAGCMMAPSVD